MNNLDLIREHCAEAMRLVQEIEDAKAKPEPAPEYKLEAGCKVRRTAHENMNCGAGVVLFVHPDVTIIEWDNGLTGRDSADALTVTAPATPEVGDYVRIIPSGKCCAIDGYSVERRKAYFNRAEGGSFGWCRSDFVILAKAPKSQ